MMLKNTVTMIFAAFTLNQGICASATEPSIIAERRILFEKISLRHLTESFNEEFLKLEQDYKSGVMTEDIYTADLRKILWDADRRSELLIRNAEKMARLDKSAIPVPEKIAMVNLEGGKTVKAVELYKKQDYPTRFVQAIKEGADSLPLQELRNSIERQTLVFCFAGGEENMEAALEGCRRMAAADSLNPASVVPYLDVLSEQKQYGTANRYLQRLIKEHKTVGSFDLIALKGIISLNMNGKSEESAALVELKEEYLRKIRVANQIEASRMNGLMLRLARTFTDRKRPEDAADCHRMIIEKNRERLIDGDVRAADDIIVNLLQLCAIHQTKEENSEVLKLTKEGMSLIEKYPHALKNAPADYRGDFLMLSSQALLKSGNKSEGTKHADMAIKTIRELTEQKNHYYFNLAMACKHKKDLIETGEKETIRLLQTVTDCLTRENRMGFQKALILNKCREQLACLYLQGTKKKEAFQLFAEAEQSFRIYAHAYPEKRFFSYAHLLSEYGAALLCEGYFNTALKYNQNALDLYQEIHKEYDVSTWILRSGFNLSQNLVSLDRNAEAMEVIKMCEPLIEKIADPQIKQSWINRYVVARQLNPENSTRRDWVSVDIW